ncbi:unnamed protein product [Cochlearia groenlandica]
MAESEERSSSSSSPPQLTLPPFVTNLFPFLKPKSPALVNNGTKPKQDVSVVEKETTKYSTNESVSFPYNPTTKEAETLKVEAEVSSGRTSNSLVLWQVYALGGFLVLKWAWARWNERNETGGKKDDEPSHGDDDEEDGHEE